MTATPNTPEPKGRFLLVEALTSLGLFLLALLPRAYDLQRFVTADEAKWVYRSAQFLAACLRGDLAATSVNLTPAVTTTWLGSLGLALYYRFNQTTLNSSLLDWLLSLPEFRTELDVLAAARWPMVIFTSLGVVAIYLLSRRLFNPTLAFIAAVFIALDPQTVALSRVLGHDAPTAVFMTLSILLLLLAVDPAGEQKRRGEEAKRRRSFEEAKKRRNEETKKGEEAEKVSTLRFPFSSPLRRLLASSPPRLPASPSPPRLAPSSPLFLSLSGVTAGLAFLSKAPALFLVPFAGLVFLSRVWGHSAALYFWFKRLVGWGLVAYLTFVVCWPAAWLDPLGRPLAVVQNGFLSATDQEEAEAEGYWLVPDLGPFYYLVNGAFKLSPLVMVGAGLAVVFIFVKRRRGEEANDEWAYGESVNGERSSIFAPFRRSASSPRRLPTAPPPRLLASSPPRLVTSPLLWLLAFSLLFTVFLTLSDKRSARYILPAFPALALVAACGWLELYQGAGGRRQVAGSAQEASSEPAPGQEQARGRQSATGPVASRSSLVAFRSSLSARRFPLSASRFTFAAVLALAALATLLPYAPYYFTYFNPLLGGPYTAPHLVKIGWGEGLDRVGRFLQREGELRDSRVGTAYASTVAPFFEGDLAEVTGASLDYVVLYSKQVQSGQPSPTFIRYFEQIGPIFSVDLNGIHYADVYPGPAVQPSLALKPGLDPAILPKPIGFRPLTPYGHIGQGLEVDVLWLADEPLPPAPSVVSLAPLSALDFSQADHAHGLLADEDHPGAAPEPASGPPPETKILAEGPGRLTRLAGDLIVSRHHLALPTELDRGLYTLSVDGRPLGEIELRHFQIPADMASLNGLVFGQQIALAAFQFTPTADYIGVTLAWQAQTSRLPDYTVFVQLLEAETNERRAGVDQQPLQGAWPTSRWVKNEVVVDEYLVAIPPGLPPGYYKIIAGLYRPETGRRLTLPDGQDHWLLPSTFIWQGDKG